mgnify:CR=1 FL=1
MFSDDLSLFSDDLSLFSCDLSLFSDGLSLFSDDLYLFSNDLYLFFIFILDISGSCPGYTGFFIDACVLLGSEKFPVNSKFGSPLAPVAPVAPSMFFEGKIINIPNNTIVIINPIIIIPDTIDFKILLYVTLLCFWIFILYIIL